MTAAYWTRERIIGALQAWALEHGRTPAKVRDWGRAAPDHPASPTVDNCFGSWSAAIEAAGLTPNVQGVETYWTADRVAAAMLDWLLVHGEWPTKGDWRHVDPAGRWPAGCHAERLAGTWHNMKRLAGWTALCRGCEKPLTGKQRLWCSEHCRKHPQVVVVEVCRGCGCDLDVYASGCDACSHRRGHRRKRAFSKSAARTPVQDTRDAVTATPGGSSCEPSTREAPTGAEEARAA